MAWSARGPAAPAAHAVPASYRDVLRESEAAKRRAAGPLPIAAGVDAYVADAMTRALRAGETVRARCQTTLHITPSRPAKADVLQAPLNAAFELFGLVYWSPVYVRERLGTGTAESAILSSMFDLAGPIGTLAGGYLSDRMFQSKRMPVAIIALLSLAVLMMSFQYLPLTRLGIGAGLFMTGFLMYIPDSLISGTAAIDFGTKKGASTASGLINGCGSIGQIIGVTLPGWIGKLLSQAHEIWNAIFLGLGVSLALAALLLVPQWNRVPAAAIRAR